MPASKSGTPDKFALNLDFLFDELENKCGDLIFNRTNLGQYMPSFSGYQKINRHIKGETPFFKPDEYLQIAIYVIGKICANADNKTYLNKRCRLDYFVLPENDTTINKVMELINNNEIITNYDYQQYNSPLEAISANLNENDKKFVNKFIFDMKNENFQIDNFALNLKHLIGEFGNSGLTQKSLADIFPTGTSSVSNYLNGKKSSTLIRNDDDYTKTVKHIIKTLCERKEHWDALLGLCKSIESDESINKILDDYKNLPEQIVNDDSKIPSAIVDAITKIMKKEIFAGIDYRANTVDLDTYTLTFDSNGGTEIIPQIVQHGATATEPNNPAKAGYIFKCWQRDGKKFHFNTPITDDITLVAEWEKSHRVIFVANDGIEIVPKILQIKHGDIVQEPKNPTRAGHIFVGWKHNGEKFYFNTSITDDITLVAEWAPYGSVVMASLPSPHIEKLENMISLDTVLKNAHESFFVSGVSNISLNPRRETLLKRSEKISIRLLISNLKNKELQFYQKHLRRIETFEDDTIAYMAYLIEKGNGKIEVRVADFIMPAFFVASDENTANGIIHVAHTFYNTSSAERPRLYITPAHGDWYELYRQQIEEIWKAAMPF